MWWYIHYLYVLLGSLADDIPKKHKKHKHKKHKKKRTDSDASGDSSKAKIPVMSASENPLER